MDEIVRTMTTDGFVKISAVTARGIVERAREIHDLSPTASAALGRMLCGASMLGELMKEEDASRRQCARLCHRASCGPAHQSGRKAGCGRTGRP